MATLLKTWNPCKARGHSLLFASFRKGEGCQEWVSACMGPWSRLVVAPCMHGGDSAAGEDYSASKLLLFLHVKEHVHSVCSCCGELVLKDQGNMCDCALTRMCNT